MYRQTLTIALICLLSVLAVSRAQNVHCSQRINPEFDRRTGSFYDNDQCPFIVNAERWTPGESIMMQILDAGNTDNPFQLFLVSVQHGNSLIGEMRGGPESNDSVLTCGTTTIKNADTSNKTEVEFYWTAPSDLDADQVIVRASVGTLDEYWRDCDMYYLDKSDDSGTVEFSSTEIPPTTVPVSDITEITTTIAAPTTTQSTTVATTQTTTVAPTTMQTTTVAPTTTQTTTVAPTTTQTTTVAPTTMQTTTVAPTTTQTTTVAPTTTQSTTVAPTTTQTTTAAPSTTTRRLAPPDGANQGPSSTALVLQTTTRTSSNSAISCSQYGNTYEIIAGTECSQFKQIAGGLEYTFNCPPYTIFMAEHCSCSSFGDCALP